jgi:hypothetical protein
MRQVYFITLLILLGLLGLGAIFGGGAMILDPTGSMIRLPLELLDHSILPNFLIPGIVLFLLFGLLPLLLFRPLLKKPYSRFFEGLNLLSDMHWAWTFVIYIGFGLIIWIQVQMTVIEDVHWVHDLYTYWAIFILAMALMPGVRERYKKEYF